MQEFVLRQSALAVAGCFTGVSDGVLNPYTAVIAPGVVIPVASNDSGNPSLSPIEVGGNFNITEKLMTDLRQRVRRTMIGPEPTEGAVRSATEVGVNDRNRLWAMNGEFSRIQAELLSKIIARGVFILQRRGLMPKIKVDGRQVSVKYTSPFAKSQNADDVNALQNTFAMFEPMAEAGMAAMGRGLKLEDAPAWVAMKNGVPAALIRNEEELAKFDQAMKDAAAQQQAAQSGGPAQ
jgi:hypothetical protein